MRCALRARFPRPRRPSHFPPDPFPQSERVLDRTGYVLTTRPHNGEEGTLSRGARRASVHLLRGQTYSVAGALGKGTAVLQLSTEFGVARELPQSSLDGSLLRSGLLPRGRVVFRPRLGRTVTACADVIVDERSTPASAKADVGRYFASVEGYAQSHGGTGRPSQRATGAGLPWATTWF